MQIYLYENISLPAHPSCCHLCNLMVILFQPALHADVLHWFLLMAYGVAEWSLLCPLPNKPNFSKFTKTVYELAVLSELFCIPVAPNGMVWMVSSYLLMSSPRLRSFSQRSTHVPFPFDHKLSIQ